MALPLQCFVKIDPVSEEINRKNTPMPIASRRKSNYRVMKEV